MLGFHTGSLDFLLESGIFIAFRTRKGRHKTPFNRFAGKKQKRAMPENRRIREYDLTRGIAILIMLVINFKAMFSVASTVPVWLVDAIDFMDRRAAALLVMVAGSGLTLITRNKKGPENRLGRTKVRSILLKRSVFLFICGYWLSLLWPADILHYYAVFILIGILFSEAAGRTLITFAVLFWLIGFIQGSDLIDTLQQMAVDHSFPGQILDILFTGFYPVFPWMSFFLAGMWLARKDIRCPVFRSRLLTTGLVLLLISELIGGLPAAFWTGFFRNPADSLQAYLELYHTIDMLTVIDLKIPSPLSVVSGMGSGLCLITLGLWLSDHLPEKRSRVLVTAGKASLTIYIGHILILQAAKAGFSIGENLSILVVSGFSLLFFLLSAGLLEIWLKNHANGPLESIMRKFPYTGPVLRISKRHIII